MLTSLETGPTGAQKGLIPFLGTFLNYLLLLDTNMEDYLEGNEINFEKRSEEFKVTEQIFLLQEAVHLYTLRLRSDLGPGSRPWSPSARMRATACPATWSPHRRGPARCAGFSCPRRTARLSAQGSSPDP
nr:ral guanine nucleotide dissociation stimulator-like 1 isoform X1 [Equus caballus]